MYKNPHDPRNIEAKKRWYERNKEVHKADRIKRTNRNRKFIREYKTNKKCTDCGIVYPWYVMEFDHINNDKLWNLSAITSHSLETVKKEIAKCEVVCSNCHKERTYMRKQALLAQRI